MKRKLTETLKAWRLEAKKPCLLVKGARQVGKTYTIDEFAKENYKHYIYINFELMPEYKRIFEGNLDIRTLKMNLEVNFPGAMAGVKGTGGEVEGTRVGVGRGTEERKGLIGKAEPNDILIFLDEIQACPQARVALKSFAMDGTMDVVASGSLLGLYYKEVSSYPVGYERAVELFPMDFEEFLWALGLGENLIQAVRENFQQILPVSESVAGKLEEYFRMYLLTGGMPNVVKTFVQSQSLAEVRVRQREILESYKNDVMKYAETADKQKILKTFESVPMQLAKRNKKFMYSDIDVGDDNASERKYGAAIGWLKDAGIVNFCYNLQEPALPLSVNRRLEAYKIYMRDTGLLVAMLDAGVQKAVVEKDLYINEGALVENVCAEEIVTRYEMATYFERKGKLEVDFVLDVEGEVVAVEVKSGANRQAKSLRSLMQNYRGVGRFVMLEPGGNFERDAEGVEHYPLWGVMFL